MKLFKRILTGFLVASLAVSHNFVSLADSNLGDNTNSGGGIELKPPGAGTDDRGVHMLMGYFENQGYRISIVDTEGERVTNSVDIVNYIPNVVETSKDQGLIDGFYKYIDWFGWHKAPAGKNKLNSFYFSNGIKTEEYTPASWNKNGVPVHINKYGTIETNMYIKETFEFILKGKYNAEVQQRLIDGEQGLKELGSNEKINIVLPAYYSDGFTDLLPGGAELIKLFKSRMGYMGEDNPDGIDNFLTFMVNMKAPKANNKGVVSTEEDYLFRFADSTLQARVGKEEINKATGEKK